VVHALPVLRALRRKQPEARIGWVVEEAFASLLAGDPDLDEVIPVRTRAWRRTPIAGATWRELAATRRALRNFRPDVAYDLMGNHKGALLARWSGARRRIGLRRADRREPASGAWINDPRPARGAHAVERGLSLLDEPDADRSPVDFGPAKILPAATAGAPLGALIHPGAGWGNKRYPPAAWGAVARRLASDGGLTVAVAAAPGEEDLAAEAVAAAAGAARFEPAPTLADFARLARSSRLVLGGDTGPLHLAHALGTTALMLYGPTDPKHHGPYGHPERTVWLDLPCSFCHRRFAEPKACLASLPPERVARAALALL
jgi:heptosyltransferase-1